MISDIERDILKLNHAGCFILIDSINKETNYGVIRIEDEVMVYWTYKGMEAIRKESYSIIMMRSEEDLIESGYIEKIALEDIYRVIF